MKSDLKTMDPTIDKKIGSLFYDVFENNKLNHDTDAYWWLKRKWLEIYKNTLNAPLAQIEYVQVQTKEGYFNDSVERLIGLYEHPNGIEVHKITEDEKIEIEEKVSERLKEHLEKTPEYSRTLNYVFVPMVQIIEPYNISFYEFLDQHTQTYQKNVMMSLPISSDELF